MDKRIDFLKKQILSNLQHSPTIEEMATAVNLSESHISKTFQKESRTLAGSIRERFAVRTGTRNAGKFFSANQRNRI